MYSSTGTVTSFDYDGLGRRLVIGQSDASGNHAETRYLWCGDELCGARDVNGQVLADYFPQGEQHDNYTQAGQRETANAYYLRDQIGSVIGVMDTTGNLLGSTDYTSYGMTRSETGQQADFGYAGMLKNPIAGLYLTKYRAYSPSAGRWFSRDPIGMAGGENVYAYVGGDPVGNYDPYGLWSFKMEFYYGAGGAIFVTGHGFSLTAGGIRLGIGLGAGISINPLGGPPDRNVTCESNSIGLFAEGGIDAYHVNASAGGNVGATQKIGTGEWSFYGGHEPSLDVGNFTNGWPIKFGARALGFEGEVSGGLELTHYYSRR